VCPRRRNIRFSPQRHNEETGHVASGLTDVQPFRVENVQAIIDRCQASVTPMMTRVCQPSVSLMDSSQSVISSSTAVSCRFEITFLLSVRLTAVLNFLPALGQSVEFWPIASGNCVLASEGLASCGGHRECRASMRVY